MVETSLVYVPYANDESEPTILDAVKLNLEILGFPANFVKMRHEYSYGEFLNQLWDKGDMFVIVEHDCFPYPNALNDILGCPEPICSFGGTLQCAKITPHGEAPIPPKTTWMHCDVELFKKFPPHVHFPEVVNLNRSNIPR